MTRAELIAKLRNDHRKSEVQIEHLLAHTVVNAVQVKSCVKMARQMQPERRFCSNYVIFNGVLVLAAEVVQ